MTTFKAIVIEKADAGQRVGIADFDETGLMDGDVTVRVECSVTLSDLGLLGVPATRTVTAAATVPIDVFRQMNSP